MVFNNYSLMFGQLRHWPNLNVDYSYLSALRYKSSGLSRTLSESANSSQSIQAQPDSYLLGRYSCL